MAGTVKPETSPRARASYRPWMLAERAPSAWLASQTSHCAAAVVASSVPNAAVQARSRIAPSRKAASSSMTRTVAVEMGRAAQGGEQVGGRGRDVGHRSEVSSFGGQASNGTARAADMGRPPSPGGEGRRSMVALGQRSSWVSG